LRQAAKFVNDETTDRVVIVVAELGTERGVEVLDLGGGLDTITAGVVEHDITGGLIEIVFVLNVADDLFQHVLDGDEAGYAAVLIDDDGHVIVAGAELAQQDIEALGFWNEDSGAQRATQIEVAADKAVEQVLGEQDADHVVLVLIDSGETRVRGLDDEGSNLFGSVVDID